MTLDKVGILVLTTTIAITTLSGPQFRITKILSYMTLIINSITVAIYLLS